jgi:oxalate decarboxylase/phosphoglucose isomerase-like protein (cupin superfamily)
VRGKNHRQAKLGISRVPRILKHALEQGKEVVSFIPAGYPHWSTNVGNTMAKLIFVFPTGFKTAELGQTAAQIAPNVLNETLQVSIPDAIRNERRAIVPWN